MVNCQIKVCGWLECWFHFDERRTDLLTECRAGIATFMVMAYIIFVNPTILGSVADSRGEYLQVPAVLTVTCLTAGLLSLLMGFAANYPFALAPGMGLNAVVAFQLIGHLQLTWPQAMSIIMLEGILILLLVVTRFRLAVMEAIPLVLKRSIGAGIGLFIALIGFSNSGLVVAGQGTVLTLGNLKTLPVMAFALGFVFTAWMLARKVKGALLWGILLTTSCALLLNYFWGGGKAFGQTALIPSSVLGSPQGLYGPGAIFGRIDFGFFSKLGLVSSLLVTFSLLLSDFFDTMGTVIGISEEGQFLDQEGNLPGIQRVLLVDSLGAAFGGFANASSNTTYIESAAGIAEGGRTGLTSVVTGILFLLAMFLNPLASIVPKEATAPALILVGFFMMTLIQEIPWRDFEEAIPAFVTILVMPLTYSITNGIGAGMIVYVLLKLLSRKFREIHLLTYGVAAAFVIHFLHSA